MKIIIGADLVPTEENYEIFKSGDAEKLVGKRIKSILEKADYRIFNNELALTDKKAPIKKAGPNIGAPTACVKGYKALGVDLLGVANNHILDHGYDGFISTLNALDKANIAHVGAGLTKEDADKPYFFEKENKKIGIYACCEHEFSWVEDYGFGANGFDALYTPDRIAEIKKQCDYLIVLYHGGKEHYEYPSPYLRKVCRKIAEKGADLILCQHTHCVGTEEDYAGAKIIYGQGNFIFAKHLTDKPTWGKGFLVCAEITDKGVKYDYIPYHKTDVGIAYDETGEILKGLKVRSEEIKQAGFIEKKFEDMAAETVKDRYVCRMLQKHPITDEDLSVSLFHFAECEVHRECLITGLRKKLGLGKYGEHIVK